MIRRALIVSSAERYLVLAVNFVAVALVARLLTPEEVGVSVIGIALIGVAETLRDFGTSGFLVQRPELTREDTRTAATVMLLLTLVASAAIWLAAEWIAQLSGQPSLAPFLQVLAVGFLAGALSGPLMALMRRDLRFERVALINIATALTTALTTVGLAASGAGTMSFAFALLASGWVAALLALWSRGEGWIFRPDLSRWRQVLGFGVFSSAYGVLGKTHELLPSLLLGRYSTAEAVGFYSRALVVCSLPDKALFTGILPVALPALALEVRRGRCLAPAYLRALAYITAVQWPALVLVALFAEPIVAVLLGPQWEAVVPVVRVMALALLFAAPSVLAYPVLAASGAVHGSALAMLATLPVAGTLLLLAAPHGPVAASLTLFATIPLQSAADLFFIRRQLPFRWSELGAAVRPSLAVTVCAAAPPLAILSLAPAGPSLPLTALAAVAAGLGWLNGLLLMRHPMLVEVRHLWAASYRRGRSGRAIARQLAPLARASTVKAGGGPFGLADRPTP